MAAHTRANMRPLHNGLRIMTNHLLQMRFALPMCDDSVTPSHPSHQQNDTRTAVGTHAARLLLRFTHAHINPLGMFVSVSAQITNTQSHTMCGVSVCACA